MVRRRLLGVVVLACGISFLLSCKKQTAPAEVDVVQAGIEVQGGLKKLKAGSSFSARYHAEGPGGKVDGSLQHNAGSTLLKYVDKRTNMVAVAAPEKCWKQTRRVVVPCAKAEREHTTRLARLLEASWLWPLKERSDRTVKTEEIEQGGKIYSSLTILAGGEALGRLIVDNPTRRVVGLKMQTSLDGRNGELVGTFSAFEKNCGIEMPMKREYTFDGKPLVSEKIDGVICEEVPVTAFDPPEQVKNGFVELRVKGGSNLACSKLVGPLTGVGATLGKVMDFLREKNLRPAGAARLIHQKGPPEVKRPAGFVTDVCWPVGKDALLLPDSMWQGEVYLRGIIADEVLMGYGYGDVVQATNEISALLVADARKRGRKPAGLMVQILHMPTDEFPPDQRVSEIHVPLD